MFVIIILFKQFTHIMNCDYKFWPFSKDENFLMPSTLKQLHYVDNVHTIVYRHSSYNTVTLTVIGNAARRWQHTLAVVTSS